MSDSQAEAPANSPAAGDTAEEQRPQPNVKKEKDDEEKLQHDKENEKDDRGKQQENIKKEKGSDDKQPEDKTSKANEDQRQSPPPPPKQLPIGALDKPATTVFVGGINERAPNSMLKELLGACGFVNSWKRVTGADGKLQTFGFCEFADPESTMICVRLLNRLEIGDKPLIVRVDAGTQAKLDEYKQQRGLPDAPDEARDETTRRSFTQVTQRFKAEMERVEEGEIDNRAPKLVGPKQSIDEMDLDVDKRSIINREIEFFRSRYRDDSPKLTEQLERERERERERRRREKREKERERDREKDREDRREQKRAAEKTAEADDEAMERRRQEKKLLDKEESYQQELRHWTQRERKKARDAEREREREEKRLTDEAREARRMRDFLAEYDDEADDAKFYKGEAFRRRLREREKERELDERDRARERDEVDEARQRLLAEGRDPADVEAICAELDEARDAHTRRLLEASPAPPDAAEERRHLGRPATADDSAEDAAAAAGDGPAAPAAAAASINGAADNHDNNDDDDGGRHHRHDDNDDDDDDNHHDIADDVDDADSAPLPPPQPLQQHAPASAAMAAVAADAAGDSTRQQPTFANEEEKKALIKRLIDRIPTLKDELFAYPLDWSIVDAALMQSRVKPWINKKIIEYIGEEEAQLTEFVCSKVMDQTKPEAILDEIAMVLDEEAEVFIVKLWRLLIYETEAKKAGLVK